MWKLCIFVFVYSKKFFVKVEKYAETFWKFLGPILHATSTYTVTKANQNEALLWKVAVLGMEKPPVGVGTFCPSPMLAFYIPPCRKCPPAWRNVKYQYGPGARCSRTNRGLFPSQKCSFPEKSFIIYILCPSIQGNHGLGVKDRITIP